MKNRMHMKILVLILLLSPVFTITLMAQNKEWIAPTEAENINNQFKGDASLLKESKKLYVQMCAMCHGDTGKGDGIAGAALNPQPGNFTSEKIQTQSDGAIFWKMTKGRTPMLAYETILSEKQRWGLVNYIRELGNK